MNENIIENKYKLMEGQLLECHTKVLVLAINEEGNIVIISSYIKKLDEWILEMPNGDVLFKELPMDAATRIMITEAGVYAENIEPIGIYNPKSSEIDIIYLFVASQFTDIKNHLGMDFDKYLVCMTPDRLGKLIEEGVFCQEPGIKAFTNFYFSAK